MGAFRSVYSDFMSSAISNNSPFSCALALCFFLPMMCATPAAAEDLFERLRETRLTNLEDVIEAAEIDKDEESQEALAGFCTPDKVGNKRIDAKNASDGRTALMSNHSRS